MEIANGELNYTS